MRSDLRRKARTTWAQKVDDPRPGGDGGRRGAAPGGLSRSHSAATGGCDRRGFTWMCSFETSLRRNPRPSTERAGIHQRLTAYSMPEAKALRRVVSATTRQGVLSPRHTG
jgi:hypothetical protein